MAKSLRLTRLPELLRLRPHTALELSRELGVPRRTVQRDLEALRAMGHELESPRRGQYALPQGSSLDAVETLAVYAAVRLLYHHAPTSNRHYKSALEKIARLMPQPVRQVAAKSVADLPERRFDDRTLERVALAWFNQKVLAFDYVTPDRDTAKRHELEVYLVEVSRANLAPYVVGRLRRKGHITTFKLSRMHNAEVLEATYAVPESFDPSAHLAGAWGVIGAGSGRVAEVRLAFHPGVRYRLDEGGFPGLQIVGERDEGWLEAKIAVGLDRKGFPLEFLSFVQGWGPRVRVLGPPDLREKWLEEAREVAESEAKALVNRCRLDRA